MTEMTALARLTGLVGMVCSVSIAFAMIFQIRRIKKRKSSKDISLILFCVAIVSFFFWFLHGISIHNVFMMIAQGSGLTFASITFAYALKYRKGVEMEIRAKLTKVKITDIKNPPEGANVGRFKEEEWVILSIDTFDPETGLISARIEPFQNFQSGFQSKAIHLRNIKVEPVN